MKFNSDRFSQYLAFVEERHNVWVERQVGAPAPWTSDPILASRKFTNVFRVLDPGSQFVFALEADNPYTTLMRLFLYRHTGRVEPWLHLAAEYGDFAQHPDDLDDVLQLWKDYRAAGNPIFTGAYLVYPQSATPGSDKLESIIRLTQRLFGPEGVAQDFVQAKSQAERFGVLRRNKGVADFMSMQILTDWGYTTYAGSDRENEFVVPGPGCRKGIMTITDTPDQVNFLHFARAEVLMGDDVPTLNLANGTRQPSIMDIQNTLCEFSKYARFMDKGSPGKPYIPAHPGEQPAPVLPAHWETTN